MPNSHTINYALGEAHRLGNDAIVAPSTGGIVEQKGKAYGVMTVGAGTYKLPDSGLPMFVRATGAVQITSKLNALVSRLATGQVALCYPLTATTWAALTVVNSVEGSLPNARYVTSSTATTLTAPASALSGAKHVYFENTADGTLALTTRTAALMVTDILGFTPTGTLPAITYLLTIVNRGNNTITITGGDNVVINGEATIATLVTRTYVVDVAGPADITFTSVSKGTIET